MKRVSNFKKCAAILLAICLTATLFAGCANNNGATTTPDGAAAASGTQLRLACVDSYWAMQGYNAARLESAVNYETKGTVTVNVFPGGELGEEQEILEAIQIGKIDMSVATVGKLSPFTTALTAFDVPFLFTDPVAEMEFTFASSDTLTPAVEAMLEKASEEAGMRFLSPVFGGAKDTYFNTPVESWDETAGMKIRLQPSEVQVDAWTSMGLSPATISFSETFTSLQTNVVEACEFAKNDYVDYSFYDVAPYVVETQHLNYANVYVISEAAWDALSSEQQVAMKTAAVKSAYVESNLALGFAESLSSTIDKVAKNVVELSADELYDMRVDALPKLLEKYADTIGKDVIIALGENDAVLADWVAAKGW